MKSSYRENSSSRRNLHSSKNSHVGHQRGNHGNTHNNGNVYHSNGDLSLHKHGGYNQPRGISPNTSEYNNKSLENIPHDGRNSPTRNMDSSRKTQWYLDPMDTPGSGLMGSPGLKRRHRTPPQNGDNIYMGPPLTSNRLRMRRRSRSLESLAIVNLLRRRWLLFGCWIVLLVA